MEYQQLAPKTSKKKRPIFENRPIENKEKTSKKNSLFRTKISKIQHKKVNEKLFFFTLKSSMMKSQSKSTSFENHERS